MKLHAHSAEVGEGDIIAGKYRVERVLAAGGMGVVFEAIHVGLKDRVAIKLMRFPQLAEGDVVKRFLREAQAAARIKSPHVARVLDVGALESGSPYMVMEFLEGHDLQHHIETSGPLPIPEAVRFTLQLCEALAAAHARGIVHRDIKPGNLFLTFGPDGEPIVKVVDFGISKIADGLNPETSNLTETERSMGSPAYMAPEQMRSARRVDERADIWSTGAVLYELVTQRLPFVAVTTPELYALVLDANSRPTPMREIRPDVPEALDQVVARCMAKEPGERFANVADLAAALAPFADGWGESSAARCARILSAGEAGRPSAEYSMPGRAPAGEVPAIMGPTLTGNARPEPASSAAAAGSGVDRVASTRGSAPGEAHLAPSEAEGAGAGETQKSGLETSTAFGRTGRGSVRAPTNSRPPYFVALAGAALLAGAVVWATVLRPSRLEGAGEPSGAGSSSSSSSSSTDRLARGEPGSAAVSVATPTPPATPIPAASTLPPAPQPAASAPLAEAASESSAGTFSTAAPGHPRPTTSAPMISAKPAPARAPGTPARSGVRAPDDSVLFNRR